MKSVDGQPVAVVVGGGVAAAVAAAVAVAAVPIGVAEGSIRPPLSPATSI